METTNRTWIPTKQHKENPNFYKVFEKSRNDLDRLFGFLKK